MVTVIMVVLPFAPGVTVGGLNDAVAPAGKPEADMVTGLLNAPPSGGTVTLTLTEPPSWDTVAGVVGAATVNAGVTACETAVEVAEAKVALPEYAAVMLNVPPLVKLLVVKVATPLALGVRLPICVVPLKKFTVPRSEPVGAGVMVAVKTMGCPAAAGFGEEVSVTVVVVAPLMVSVTAAEAELAK